MFIGMGEKNAGVDFDHFLTKPVEISDLQKLLSEQP